MSSLKIISKFSLLFTAFIFLTCSKEAEITTRPYPVIDTQAASAINENGATFNADILNLGLAGIKDFGFVYEDFTNPTLEESDRISLGEITERGHVSTLANRNLIKAKKYYIRAYAISKESNIIVYGQEIEFTSLGGKAPEITDFSPQNGVIGDTILITGAAFSNAPHNNLISFGTNKSPLVKFTPDSIWCRVPLFTALGKNTITLTVGDHTIQTNGKFDLNPMTLTSYSPKSISFGDQLIIQGSGFPRDTSYLQIVALGKKVKISSLTSTKIYATISSAVVLSESAVSVVAGAQTLDFPGKIKLKGPAITDFNPKAGAPGTEVLLTGNNFSPVSTNNSLQMNNKPVKILSSTTTSLRIEIPTITPGSYSFSLTVANQNVVSAGSFTIQ